MSMMRSIQIESSIDLAELRKFIRKEILPGARERDDTESFPIDLFGKLHQMGYVTPFVPKDLGGADLPSVDLMCIGREIAYGSAGMTCALAGNMLSLVPVLLHGTPSLRKKVADGIQSELQLGSFCFTEPEAGSDILRIRTEATRVEGGYKLTGKKCFITNANYARHFVVVAKVKGVENPRKSMTLFYVPAGTKGLSAGKPLSKMGQRDSNTSEVYFDDVFVPEEHRIGAEGEGLKLAFQTLERSRTFFAASAVGLCDRARDLAIEFTSGREHYGKPLLDQPAIRNLLSRLETEARAAWYLTCASACYWDHGVTDLQHSSMAKMYAGNVAARFASEALELFGGWGFTREFDVERLYRDAKLYEIIEGPTFVQYAIIAKELFPYITEKPTEISVKKNTKAAA